ncbi:hypothetical protein OAG71_01965, partial [bacterium]|nr:hypothetical protein [bacterium]
LKAMRVYAAKQPGKDEESYHVTQMFIYEGFDNVEIRGNAVVARTLLTGICKRLISRDVSSNKEIAKAVFEILSNPPSGEQVSDPTKLKHFKQLRIEDDIEQLGKLATNRPGQFSELISGSPKFKSDPEISQTTETTKARSGSSTSPKPLKQTAESLPQSKQSSIGKRNAEKADDVQAPALYRGKRLKEWLKILEIDQDPQTQGEAIRACTKLYQSSDLNDEIVALLKEYLKRHASNKNSIKGEGNFAAYFGFAESLEKLPPKMVVEFFKFQLRQGNEAAIGWTYLGLLKPRDPRKFSIFTTLKPYSPELGKELKSSALELLRLIANRDNIDPYDYLLQFIVKNLLKDPTSDDATKTIRSVMVKFGPKALLKVANQVPDHILEQELFTPVKVRLFAAETTATERDELIEGLKKVEIKADGKASFILEILADVVANQLYDPNRIEFKKLQTMNVFVEKEPSENGKDYKQFKYWVPDGFKKIEINGNAVVARKLLSGICERLLIESKKSSAEITGRVLQIISKASKNKQSADPTKLDHFNRLRIKYDLEQLKNLFKKQPGEFSDFVSGKKSFESDEAISKEH